MAIRIYSTLTRKKEEFIPVSPPAVNIYTCGVTVYDDCHIGHARSLFVFDVIRRYLGYRGFKVNFVRNITDIDDKIIVRARELKIPWDELAEKYIEAYYRDIALLGIGKADAEPRATRNLADMIYCIQGLLVKGYAYEADDGVYFNVRKFPGYGKLSGQSVDEMREGVRATASEGKHDPLDFALWKKSKPGEPSWESPWGSGRPGWHIECSVMSRHYLKAGTLDIHAGGRDLVFPHHENEIAQSEAFDGRPFAKYWIHHGLLTINGQKMSKSLGNFITIRDFMRTCGNACILKLFFLQAHYAHPIDYTDGKIDEARKALERLVIFFHRAGKTGTVLQGTVPVFPEIEDARAAFFEAMDDDFNMPQALASVFKLLGAANKRIDDAAFAAAGAAALTEMLAILGIPAQSFHPASGLTSPASAGTAVKESAISDADVERRISERLAARKNKDYARSDAIRKELEAQGVILEDTKDGNTTWRRKL